MSRLTRPKRHAKGHAKGLSSRAASSTRYVYTMAIVRGCAALLLAASGAHGHGAMLVPTPRNAIDAELPAWSGGKAPATGVIEPLAVGCTNGSAVCDCGQSVFWFSRACLPTSLASRESKMRQQVAS